MIPHWAKVGAKVVCIRDCTRTVNYRGHPGFKKGEILTIDSIHTHIGYGVCLSFQERHPMNQGQVDGFRPLITIEDDMKLFEHLKNPTLVDKLDLLAERMNELAAY